MSANGRSILLVGDDQEIRELLETRLSRASFQVRSVSRGANFRQALYEEEAGLATLDVMLSDEGGLSPYHWTRSHQRLACVLIIMLIASSDEVDRMVGPELGVDDYLDKPFSPRELLTRTKALLRRVQFAWVYSGDALVFEDWRLDTVSHRLFHEDGEEFPLSGTDFALLKLFLDHPQQIPNRDTIANATRDRGVLSLERIVDMAVSRLRQHLHDTDKVPRLVQTVHGSGYLLTAQMRPYLQP